MADKHDDGEKLHINLYPTREGSNCRITNFVAAKNTLLLALRNFIIQRKGVPFEDSRGNFSLPIRYTAEGLENLLINLDIDAEVTEPNSIENKTVKAMATVSTSLNWRDTAVGFGKYKNTKWKDVPIEYLQWATANLSSGANKDTAAKELQYRSN